MRRSINIVAARAEHYRASGDLQRAEVLCCGSLYAASDLYGEHFSGLATLWLELALIHRDQNLLYDSSQCLTAARALIDDLPLGIVQQ